MVELTALLLIVAIGVLVYTFAEVFSGISSFPSEWLEDHEYYSLNINEFEYDDYPGLGMDDGIFNFPEKASDFRWYHVFTLTICLPLILLSEVPVIKIVVKPILDTLWNTNYHFMEKRRKGRVKKWQRKMVQAAKEGRLKVKERPVKETPVGESPVIDERFDSLVLAELKRRFPDVVRAAESTIAKEQP